MIFRFSSPKCTLLSAVVGAACRTATKVDRVDGIGAGRSLEAYTNSIVASHDPPQDGRPVREIEWTIAPSQGEERIFPFEDINSHGIRLVAVDDPLMP
jgi:hypothetical protein